MRKYIKTNALAVMSNSLKIKISAFLISILYLLFLSLFTVPGIEHYVIIAFYNVMLWINAETRKFMLAFTIFVIFAILYDLMKLYPNYLVNSVDISGLYFFEKSHFGIKEAGEIITPNEYFNRHHSITSDIISAIFYLNWIPVPLAFAVYLYFKRKQVYYDFAYTFFIVNLIGFAGYYIHPAAPPWYIELHGFSFHPGVMGNTAGFARFDQLIHLPVFHAIYAKNSNVFAAIPSLHCAYPVVVLYYGLRAKLGKVNLLLVLFMAGIWFAAVYSGHHYVTDVILGVWCAVIGIALYQWKWG